MQLNKYTGNQNLVVLTPFDYRVHVPVLGCHFRFTCKHRYKSVQNGRCVGELRQY